MADGPYPMGGGGGGGKDHTHTKQNILDAYL